MPFGAYAPLPIRLGGSAEEGWSPAQHARLCADLAAAKRVAPLAVVRVLQTATPDAAVVAYCGQNGNGLAYAPAITDHGEGDVTLTWPAYWTDDYDVQHPIKIRHVSAGYTTSGPLGVVVAQLVTIRSVRLRSFFGAATEARFTLKVW